MGDPETTEARESTLDIKRFKEQHQRKLKYVFAEFSENFHDPYIVTVVLSSQNFNIY